MLPVTMPHGSPGGGQLGKGVSGREWKNETSEGFHEWVIRKFTRVGDGVMMALKGPALKDRGRCSNRLRESSQHHLSTSVARSTRDIPVERQLALYELAAECPGTSRDELVRHASEFFGWRRTGRDIRSFLDSGIDELLRRGRLRETNGRIAAFG